MRGMGEKIERMDLFQPVALLHPLRLFKECPGVAGRINNNRGADLPDPLYHFLADPRSGGIDDKSVEPVLPFFPVFQKDNPGFTGQKGGVADTVETAVQFGLSDGLGIDLYTGNLGDHSRKDKADGSDSAEEIEDSIGFFLFL